MDGKSQLGKGRNPGIMRRCLASDEGTAGSIGHPVESSHPPTCSLVGPSNLMAVSDFGSRMGAAMSTQARLDVVIVAAGRSLNSLDVGFRSPVTGRPVCV
jgi:hypothetical protein